MINSLRLRLTLIFIGLAVGPLILVGAIIGLRSYASLEQQGLALQREIAATVGSEIRAFIEGRENELILLDEAYGLGIREPEEQQAILSSMLLYQHVYQEVVLLNFEGQEQIRLSRTSVILDDDLQSRAGNEEFLYPATCGETYFSPVRFDEAVREPLVTISIPLFDQRSGEVVSVLVADLRFKKVWELLAAIELPNGGRAYVVDRVGQVVAHRNPAVVLRGATIDIPETDGRAEGLSGTEVIIARDILQFGNQELIVLAEQPVSTALELATNSIRIAVAATSVALVSAVILVVLTTRQIVGPIEALATSAQAISDGDFSQQVEISPPDDEIADLARTFNFMARALQEREEALQAQNEALQAEITERKRAEEALRSTLEKLEELNDIVNRSPVLVLVWCVVPGEWPVEFISDNVKQVLGYTADDFMSGRISWPGVTHPEDVPRLEAEVAQYLEERKMEWSQEYRLITESGEVRWFSDRNLTLSDSKGNITHIQSIVLDVTGRKRAEEALRESEEMHRTLFETMIQGVVYQNADGYIFSANQAAERILGLTLDQMQGRTSMDPRWKAIHEDGTDFPGDTHPSMVALATGKEVRDVVMGVFSPELEDHTWINVNAVPQFRPGETVPYQVYTTFEDITERKRAEETIKRLAYRDALTGLPNRRLFDDRLNLALAHAYRNQQKMAVMLLDLDHFKDVNDELGHSVGDQLLQLVGDRVLSLLRKSDTFARMGGDEFMLLLPEADQEEDAAGVAQKVLEALREPFVFDGHGMVQL